MIKKYKIKCNLFWNQRNYYEDDELEIEDSIAKKYPHFFEEIYKKDDINKQDIKPKENPDKFKKKKKAIRK